MNQIIKTTALQEKFSSALYSLLSEGYIYQNPLSTSEACKRYIANLCLLTRKEKSFILLHYKKPLNEGSKLMEERLALLLIKEKAVMFGNITFVFSDLITKEIDRAYADVVFSQIIGYSIPNRKTKGWLTFDNLEDADLALGKATMRTRLSHSYPEPFSDQEVYSFRKIKTNIPGFKRQAWLVRTSRGSYLCSGDYKYLRLSYKIGDRLRLEDNDLKLDCSSWEFV